MASLQCSKCKAGIHYHGEPADIEYTYLLYADWERILSSRFDPDKKIYDSQGKYPLLFQSDTIEEDFPEAIYKLWKCPDCGTLHLFDSAGKVDKVFECSDTKDFDVSAGERIIIFSDYQWDALSELTLPDYKIADRFSDYSTGLISQDAFIIFDPLTGDVDKAYSLLSPEE